MAISDVLRLAVSEATGIELSQLSADTDISVSAIGKAPSDQILDTLRTKLHLGWLELDFGWCEHKHLGELIDVVNKLVPVYFEDGDRPRSVKVEGKIFRWHGSQYAPNDDPQTFRAAFEDGPWKWDTQSRFAGAGINPGHYFGLTVEGAMAEATYYANAKRIPRDLILVTLHVRLENVLDLTQKQTIVDVVEESMDVDVEVTHGKVASILFEAGKGGNGVTDYVGYRAHREGYDGILFFGARAIPELSRWTIENARPDEWFNNDFDNIRALRRNRNFINLVIFSGARLVSASRTYQWSGLLRRFWGRTPGVVRVNPYFGWTEPRLLDLSNYGSDYQDSRSRGFFLSKPRLGPETASEI